MVEEDGRRHGISVLETSWYNEGETTTVGPRSGECQAPTTLDRDSLSKDGRMITTEAPLLGSQQTSTGIPSHHAVAQHNDDNHIQGFDEDVKHWPEEKYYHRETNTDILIRLTEVEARIQEVLTSLYSLDFKISNPPPYIKSRVSNNPFSSQS